MRPVWSCERIRNSTCWSRHSEVASATRYKTRIRVITRFAITCCHIIGTDGAGLYSESVGPLFTPRRVIDALLADEIDIGPLDSYALDLMLHHQPDLASQIRIVATTDPAPIPFLVAASNCPDDVVSALLAALVEFATEPACTELRKRLCLEAFVKVAVDDYGLMTQWDTEAVRAGYAQPG
jgi:ABC transporter, phosphonate, periplasmic substrate-binding protein